MRVPITFIEQLEEASSLDASSKMIEITDHWMRECSGKPTWRELADALKTIGEVQLAQQLMQIYKTGKISLLVVYGMYVSHYTCITVHKIVLRISDGVFF